MLKDPSFEEMGLSTLRTILQQDTLNGEYALKYCDEEVNRKHAKVHCFNFSKLGLYNFSATTKILYFSFVFRQCAEIKDLQ